MKKIGWALAALTLAGVAVPARSQVLTYSGNARKYKVGVVIPEAWRARSGNAPTRSSVPHLFYALDQRNDLKPPGWDLENPLAPDLVDSRILNRWNQSVTSPTRSAANPYELNQTLSESMAAYWEVPLDSTTVEQLSQFDLLYLVPPKNIPLELQTGRNALTIPERDKLRKAVDSGVILWVERPGLDVYSTNWVYNLFVNYEFGRIIPIVGAVRATQTQHAALTSPYPIAPGELNTLFGSNQRAVQIPTLNQSLDNRSVISSLIQNQTRMNLVMAGRYGSGYVIMSADIGHQINRAVRQGDATENPLYEAGNMGGVSGSDLSNIPISALKFAFNVLSVMRESPQERIVPRRTSSTNEQLGAPLTRKWTFPQSAADPSATTFGNVALQNSAAPVTFKGVTFVPASNGRLYAFDLDPMRDMDGDGNPDDGVADLSQGATYDVIWEAPIGQRMSTPVVATLNRTLGDPIDLLYFMTEDGNLHAYEALPRSSGRFSGTPVQAWRGPVRVGDSFSNILNNLDPSVRRIPSPVFGEDRLFAVGARNLEGYVAEFDPLNGTELWRYHRPLKQANTQPARVGPIIASPTLAWVHDEATGAKDLVLYVACLAEPGQSQTGRIFAFLLSVRGEKLTDLSSNEYRSRYWLAPNAFRWTNRSFIRPSSGAVFPAPAGGEPGRIRITNPLAEGVTLYADYDLDPTDPNYKPRSTFYAFPGQGSSYPHFISSPVLGPDDTLYAVATDFGRNLSSMYAFRDQSPVAYVKWRYTLDGTTVLGAPAYHNGAVYLGSRQGQLIGFDANPTFFIDLQQPLNEGQKFQIQISQTDPSLPAGSNQVSFTYNQAMFDAANISLFDPGTNTTRLRTRIYLKRFSLSGSIALDASRPVQVKYPTTSQTGLAEETAEIRASTSICGDAKELFRAGPGGVVTGGQGNKLFEQPVVPATAGAAGLVSGPTVAGNTLFITGGDGNIYAMLADPCSLTGGGAYTRSQAPIPATVPFARTLSPTGGPVQILGPIAVADDKLVANTTVGVMVFHQPVTLVADATRILEVKNSYTPQRASATDPVTALDLGGSEVVWALSNTTRYNALPQPGLATVPVFTAPLPAPEVRTLSHPGAVLRMSSTNFLVADTGNNRVVEVDRSGTVLWELTQFADPYNILGGSEPLTLNSPTDVQRWTRTLPNGAVEIHTLIVDNGNHRVLEIRDTYGPSGGRFGGAGASDYHVLVWASQTTTADRFYDYRSAQRIDGGQLGLPAGEYTLATVSNWQVNSANETVPDTPGSSLVLLDGPARNADGSLAFQPGQLRLRYPGGKVAAFANKLTFSNEETRSISHPTSFQRYYTGSGTSQWSALMTDGEGFYDLTGALDPATRELRLLVNWGVVGRAASVPQGAGGMSVDPRATGLVAAKRLPNGNTLVLNQSSGQIFEHDPRGGPMGTGEFLRITPSTQGTNALSQPTSVDRTN
ncbi:MAG: PQQ-binding-like beta-propeller repeat protein [Armatimonadetes bacterium]|nr:PQQ-binding-like beta-propeller repeat protein [Armatimonadota bacterium]